MSRSSPRSSRCIWNSSARSRPSPTPRRRSSSASSRAARRCSTATIAQFARLAQRAREAPASRASSPSASTPSADARLIEVVAAGRLLDRAGAHPRHRRHLQARRARARIVVLNSLAVLAAASLAGADLALAALALAELQPPTGRGARITLDLPGGTRAADRRELQRQSGLDARGAGAARPGRRSARAAGASRCSATCWSSAPTAPTLHRGAGRRRSSTHGVDLVFCCGPLMRALWEALPSERRGGYAETSAALEPQVLAAVRAGRRRHGQGLARLAHGADRQGAANAAIPPRRARDSAPATRLIRCSIGWPHSPTRSRSSTCSATSRSAPAAR